MAIGLASLASPQQQGPNIQTLSVKKVVSDRLTASLAEPFEGVRTSAGVTEGLFPIRATGVSTEPIRQAAAAFIASPSPGAGRIDGHHLVINYFVLGDQVVMTPTFMGAEPARAMSGKYKGNDVLQQEQDLGLSLMRSFGPDVRTAALLTADKPGNTIKAEAFQDNLVLDFAGAKASSFSPERSRG